jgi:hypothetical protein
MKYEDGCGDGGGVGIIGGFGDAWKCLYTTYLLYCLWENMTEIGGHNIPFKRR